MLAMQAARKEGYFDRRIGHRVLNVRQGDFMVAAEPDAVLQTVLGSCVAVCLFDPVAQIGGMNHFLLPDESGQSGNTLDEASRYGSNAMELLINGILGQGGDRNQLRAKLFGGGNVIRSSTFIGDKNANFAENYLSAERIPIDASDLRGARARKVMFAPSTGKAWVKLLVDTGARDVFEKEQKNKTVAQPPENSVELF